MIILADFIFLVTGIVILLEFSSLQIISYMFILLSVGGLMLLVKLNVDREDQYRVSSKDGSVIFEQENSISKFKIDEIKQLEISEAKDKNGVNAVNLWIRTLDNNLSLAMKSEDSTLYHRSRDISDNLMVDIYYTNLLVGDPSDSDYLPGKVRINDKIMNAIGGSVNGFIEITGKKKTGAITWPAYPKDLSKQVIRMNELIRQNANVEVSEMISIRQIEPLSAVKVSLILLDPQLKIESVFINFIKKELLGYPIAVDDIIKIPSSSLIIVLLVEKLEPAGILEVNENTEISIKPKIIENNGNVSEDEEKEDS